MITIDQESKNRARLSIDLDNFADRYKTENNYYSFTSPSLSVIEKYLFYLLRNSKQVTFESKYKWRPDYLSYDYYGTVALKELLMYVNGVQCVEEFDLSNVIIPDFSAIVDICRDKYSKKDSDNLERVGW
jgi:hypothetical protein